MSVLGSIKQKLKRRLTKSPEKIACEQYYNRYSKNAFIDGKCKNEKQYEASITRQYHTIEKGLSYLEYRPGFGQRNVEALISSLEQYSKKYSTEKFFYRTALCVLKKYVEKNREYGVVDSALNERIKALPGTPNEFGGIIQFHPFTCEDTTKLDFQALVKNRHSIRHFSSQPVELDAVIRAVNLAQYTPSACNRQGWKTYIVDDKKVQTTLLENQNGNRGFGQEFDKLVVVTGDLRCFNRDREVFQVFIDGGMYAMRLLDSLFYEGIASVPLSAALRREQEDQVRKILNLDPAEMLIMFIGIGNYPEICQTTRSERKPAEFQVVSEEAQE